MKFLAYATLLTLLSPFAQAQNEGGINGGGGGAYVCRNPDGSIRSSRLIDLWETERNAKRFGVPLHIERSDRDPELQFADAIKKLAAFDPDFADAVAAEKKKIFDINKPVPLPSDEEISLPKDLETVYSPKGCKPTGMMYFHDGKGFLQVDEEIFAALETKTDVAAAWAHESIYWVLRNAAGEKTSKNTRFLVGCLFAKEKCLRRNNGTRKLSPGQLAYHCSRDQVDVFLYPSEAEEDGAKGAPMGNGSVFRAEVRKMDGLGFRESLHVLYGKVGETPNPKESLGLERAYGPLQPLGPFASIRLDVKRAGGKIILEKYGYWNHFISDGRQVVDVTADPIECKPVYGKATP
jgi:hypothetical protein